MLKLNVDMLLSTDADTDSVIVTCVTPFDAKTLPFASQVTLIHVLAFAGDQLFVDMLSVAEAVPVFLIQTVLVVVSPGFSVPQLTKEALWVQPLSE